MDVIDRLKSLLPPHTAAALEKRRAAVREVRLRAGMPAQLVAFDGDALCSEIISAEKLRNILAALMDFSLYSRENELAQGFFTLSDGSRAGVCGRVSGAGSDGARLTDIGSICVRIARPRQGSADALMSTIDPGDGVRSTLIISSPGMGKTTLLRDVARQLSVRGRNVVVADERHELAACRQGVPTIDVGPRTDVMDGCAKRVAIRLLVRGMAPDVIVTDEIGDAGDAEALADAARCGVAVVASAHARSFDDLIHRPELSSILDKGVFEYVALLAGAPGRISEIRRLGAEGGRTPVWERA